MKKFLTATLSLTALIATAASSYGQGQIVFSNYGSTAITFGSGQYPSQNVWGPAGTFEFGLYVGAVGATSLSQMTLVGTALSPNAANGAFPAGLFTGTATSLNLVPGTTYSFIVAGWSHSYGGDYFTAAGNADQNCFYGYSAVGSATPTLVGDPNGAPNAFGTGPGQIGGFSLTIIPEPSTMMLGGLGAASLLLFRRRK